MIDEHAQILNSDLKPIHGSVLNQLRINPKRNIEYPIFLIFTFQCYQDWIALYCVNKNKPYTSTTESEMSLSFYKSTSGWF